MRFRRHFFYVYFCGFIMSCNFSNASLISEKWKSVSDLKAVKHGTYISIALGGLVSMVIIIAATTTMKGGQVMNVMDLAQSLQPLYSDAAKYFMGIGLFAAGVTSAITAANPKLFNFQNLKTFYDHDQNIPQP